jgi:hypothetical protein
VPWNFAWVGESFGTNLGDSVDMIVVSWVPGFLLTNTGAECKDMKDLCSLVLCDFGPCDGSVRAHLDRQVGGLELTEIEKRVEDAYLEKH